MRLGTLVTGVTYRNVGHLAKIVATLDVLSGGRAVCGLGLGWFAAEHRAYGWPFPPVDERYALLEDALAALPVLWGPGGKPFHGRVLSLPDTAGYPRPLQERVPIVLGGGGERRTLRLAARYADVANVLGDLPTVARKAAVLAAHCAASRAHGGAVAPDHGAGRDATRPRSTRWWPGCARAASTRRGTRRRCTRARWPTRSAGFRELAEVGVGEIVVRLPDLLDPEPLHRMAPVIAAFRR